MDIESMREKLKKILNPARYDHSIGVQYTAENLAKIHGADIQKASIAGLLHDCAKHIPADKAIKMCNDLSISLSEADMYSTALLHAPLGAELIKSEFGVYDEEISSAIKYHTVGRKNMTTLEKIIYLADMIEPSRSFSGVEDMRTLAEHDLDKAMFSALKSSLTRNIKRETPVHPNTLYAWNELLIKNE